MLLQLAPEFVTRSPLLAEDDKGFDDLAAHRVGLAHDGCFHHRRMFDEGTLNFERPDPITGALDDVVPSAYEPKIALLISSRPVTSQVPIPSKTGRVLLRVAPVLLA